MSDPILDNLTPPQREAVTHLRGPMLVVAGAGSGKTRVVTRRIAYLIREGVHPRGILAMTFTNKAAGEMKRRVAELVGETPPWVGTFHSLCARFLRRDLAKLGDGRDGDFSIYDQADQQGLVKQCLEAERLDDKRLKPAAVLNRISRAKCDGIGPGDFGQGSWDDEAVARVYAGYQARLREMNALDFDDLLLLTARVLHEQPELRARYHDRFPHLLIDEYQDTNRVQYRLMRLLTGPGENVHVTGDPDQSIYSWRGAEYRNIMDFRKDFPGARIVRLEQNYRSTQTILAAANELIRYNTDRIDKDLFTENDEGEKIVVAALPSDRDEAAWVVDAVGSLRDEGTPLREMAVFYRTNAQSRPLEEALMRAGLPYQLVGGVRFYERREIKDLLAHLKLLVNPRDAVSLRRVIGARATGVGDKTLAAIEEQARRHDLSPFEFLCAPDFLLAFSGRRTKKLSAFADWCRRLSELPREPVGACVRAVLDASGLMLHIESRADRDPSSEDRLDNLEQFVNRAAEFEEQHPAAALPAFLEEVALVSDVDTWDPGADMMTLMTLHSAKGLEFPFVFVVGLEEGMLPHQNSREAAQREEERRLLYVGLTRAQRRVFLTHAATRMLWGQTQVAAPSAFLDEIPQTTTESVDLADPLAGDMDDFDPFGDDLPAAGGRRSWDRLDDGWDDESFHLADEDVLADPRPRRARGGGAFGTGDHVEHPTFGKGKVLSVSKRVAVVQFFVGGTKMLHLDAAKLRKT